MRCTAFGLTLLLAGTLAAPASAYHLHAFTGKSGSASVKHFKPRFAEGNNKSNKFFTEQYSLTTSLDGGHRLWFQVVISNLGVANGQAALRMHFQPKGQKKIKIKERFGRKKWSADTADDKLTLKLGDSQFAGDGRTWSGNLESGRLKVAFTVKNAIPAWRPGGGTVYYGDTKNSYYDITVLVPRGRIEATVTDTESGESWQVEGSAFADHSVSNVAPNLMAAAWLKMRKVGKRHTVVLSMLRSPVEYEGRWVGWFAVFSDRGSVTAGINPTLEFPTVESDSDSGYEVPTSVLLSKATGLPGFTGAIKVGKRLP